MSRRRPSEALGGPRSPIDLDGDRERDIALRLPRASGGPFELRHSREVVDRDTAIDRALLYAFQVSDKDYAKMRAAMSSVAFVRALEQDGWTVVPKMPEDHPRHPDPRCHECGERLGDADIAEVYLRVKTPWSVADGEDGPFLVHADPCYVANKEKYDLA